MSSTRSRPRHLPDMTERHLRARSTNSPPARPPLARRRARRLRRDFVSAVGDRNVRRPETRDVRVHIYGPLEARCSRPTAWCWAASTKAPGRRRRAAIRGCRGRCGGSLASIRRSGASGLSAHDFAQALGRAKVILTRAQKVGGAPTVTSRFVQRLAALAGEEWNCRSSAASASSRLRARSTSRPR